MLMMVMIKLIEELEAIKKFGEEYKKYMRKVPILSLKWKCLKMIFEKQPKNIEK